MRDLVRSITETPVTFDGRTFYVPPPTVQQALTVLSASQGVQAGVEEDAVVLIRTLRAWWPLRLSVLATCPAAWPEGSRLATRLVRTTHEDEQEEIAEERGHDSAEDMDWSGLVADYMAGYSMTLREVLAEPWGGFIVMARHLHRHRAQWQLDYLRAKGVPYMKDKRKQRLLLQDLQRVAGEQKRTQKPKPMTPEEQVAKLDAMMAAMGIRRAEA